MSMLIEVRELRAEIERLREKIQILEAEIRVMRKLPAMLDALACEQTEVDLGVDAQGKPHPF